jgi:hypothetical protein
MKKGLYCVLSSLFGFSFAVQAQSCFTISSLSPDSSSESICTADFNRDGYSDIAIGNYSSSSVSIFLGTGGGSFNVPMNFTSSGMDPRGITAADFNGDTIPDIAVANFYTYDIAVMFGTGTGALGAAISYVIGGPGSGYGCKAITSADFNGDGKVDIATGGDNNVVAVFLNIGGGIFGSATHYLLAVNTGPHDILATDLNNDGIIDLAVADGVSGDAAILLGSGSGTFGSPTYYTTGQTSTGMCSVDLNGDGNKDLITANPGSSDISVLLGTGMGVFGAATNYTIGMNPSYVSAADFDGDCDIDIAVTKQTPHGVAILLGNGAGAFGTPALFPMSISPEQICKADFNKDGKIDLAVSTGANVGVLTNCSSGTCGNAVNELTRNNFLVYPNPATNLISLKLDENSDNANVIIQNSLGQTVKEQSFSRKVDIADLAPGCYILKINILAQQSYEAKFIKQ